MWYINKKDRIYLSELEGSFGSQDVSSVGVQHATFTIIDQLVCFVLLHNLLTFLTITKKEKLRMVLAVLLRTGQKATITKVQHSFHCALIQIYIGWDQLVLRNN